MKIIILLSVFQSLASNAVSGVVIGLCLAFPVLIIATSNVIVGLMATVTILIITISVCAVIPMAGWKLGVSDGVWLLGRGRCGVVWCGVVWCKVECGEIGSAKYV